MTALSRAWKERKKEQGTVLRDKEDYLSKFNCKVKEFEKLLNMAQTNTKTEYELRFFDDIATRYKQYGKGIFLTEKSFNKLKELANMTTEIIL